MCIKDDNTRLEIIKMEYAYAKQELFYYMERYDKNDTFNNIIASMTSVLFVILKLDLFKLGDIKNLGNFGGAIILFFSLLASYLFAMTIGSLYYVLLNAARLRALEVKINKLLGDSILDWEDEVIIRLHSVSNIFLANTGILNVNVIKGVFFILLHLSIHFMLGYLLFNIGLPWLIFYLIVNGVSSLAILSQWYFYLKYLPNLFYSVIYRRKNKAMGLFDMEDKCKKDTIKVYVIGSTIFLGFLPMLIASILQDAFWLDSPYDLPLLFYTSILIGDSLFLPYFNYLFVYLLTTIKKKLKNNDVVAILILLVVSFAINYVTHFKIWITDSVTGFMDFEIGKLSLAGYIHFMYSSIQMFMTLAYFYFYRRLRRFGDISLLKRTKIALVSFTLLQIPDFFLRVYRGFPEECSSLITIPITILSFVILDFFEKSKK